MISKRALRWGYERERYGQMVKALRHSWPSEEYVRTWGAGLGPDAPKELADEWLTYIQAAATPAAIVALEEMNGQVDIRDVLPSLKVPTLILVRERDPIASVEAMRDMTRLVPGARLLVFPGASHQIGGPGLDPQPVYAAIEGFVTRSAPAAGGGSFLAALLLLDILGTTPRAALLRDAGLRQLLQGHYRPA